MEFAIRRAEPAGAAEIADVHVRTWQEAYAGLVDAVFLAGLQAEPRRRGWAAARVRSRGKVAREI